VKRQKAAVKAVTEGKGELDVKLCQLVRVMRNGELVRMSKRAGTFVTLRDLLDEVGPDVVRFTMLTRKNDAPFDFDLVKATERSRDNPVWYVQYGHARTRSVMRQAAAAGVVVEGLESVPLDRLGDAAEPGSIPPPPRDSLLMRVNRRRGQILTVMVSIAAIASFGSVVWWAHDQDVKAGGRGLEPLVVQAPPTPSRVKPDNAGGLVPP